MTARRRIGGGALQDLLRFWLIGMLPSVGTVACATMTCLATPQQPSPDGQAIRSLLSELDEVFDHGDVDDYLRHFQADHPGAHGMLAHQLERLFRVMHERHRTSTIIAGPEQVRDRTLVRVRHEIHWRPRSSSGKRPAERELVEHSYLAVRIDESGKAIPTFAVDMPPRIRCVKEGKFRCPPCNYEIGGVEGFLCVPMRPEQSLTLEAATFYLIGTDLACDVSVHIDPRPTTAVAFANKLASTLCNLQGRAEIGIASKWRPPVYVDSPPSGLDSARIVVTYPEDQPERGGRRMIFHVVTFGGLQHVLLLRGSVATLSEQQAEVDRLFDSYMLLRVDCDDAGLAAQPLRHHTGGMLRGSTYHNEHFDVTLRGPKDWHAVQLVGGSSFRVRWTGPNGSQLWLVGQCVPTGLDAWTESTADCWLMRHRKKQHLEPDPSTDNTQDWQADAHGVSSRTMILRQPDPQYPDTPRRRIVHAQVHDDLLILVDAFGGTAADEKAIYRAIDSLERK